jgi:predicted ATPase
LRDIEENVSEALGLDHTFSLCNVLTQAACPVALLARELDTVQRYVDLLREHTEARALDIWHMYAVCFDAALEIEHGRAEVGLARLQPAMEKLLRSGFGHYRTSFLMTRASGLLLVNQGSDASADIEEAIGICQHTGERWCLPELHRMRGEIALNLHGRHGVDSAVEAFNQALLLAREQRALSWELRSATSFALCVAGDRRIDGARTLLRQVYAQFTEGHARPEMIAAAKLLEDLA